MNYANDEFYYINIAPTRIYIKGQTPAHVYLQTFCYYYKGEIFRSTHVFPGVMVGNYGTIYDFRGFKIEPRIEKGYCIVTVFSADESRYKAEKVHRLIMIAHDYIDDYREKDVNHKDGNKLNNVFLGRDDPNTNLEWCTNEENVQHAHRTGLCYHKYPHSLIRELLDLMRAGHTKEEAVDKVESPFSREELLSVLKRVLYQHSFKFISKDYPDVLDTIKHNQHYDLSDEVIHGICQMILDRRTMDDIIKYAGLENKSREAVSSLLGALRRNIPKYAHITSQYFNPDEKIMRLSISPGYIRKSKFPEELMRQIMDKLRLGYTRKQAVEACGYKYDDSMKGLVGGLHSKDDARFHYVTKDYPDVLENVHRRIDLPDEIVHNICRMILQKKSIDEIMQFNNIDMDRTVFLRFLLRLKQHDSAKYKHITTQYFTPDVRVPGSKMNLPDDVVHKICKMDLMGIKVSEMVPKLGIPWITDIHIRRLLTRLRKNEHQSYRHISTKYYKSYDRKTSTS